MARQKQSLAATLDAMSREAIKDIRQTFNEAWSGKPEHAPEMGAPLNPTSQIVTADLQGQDAHPAGWGGQDAPEQDAHLGQYRPEPGRQPEVEMELERD